MVFLLLPAIAGCGPAGVASDTTVTVYVAAPLCAEAKAGLAGERGRAGNLRVRVLCLSSERDGPRLDLAVVGANARRATEDSTAVGYLEPPGPANRFSRPILESAGIAFLRDDSGAAGMARLLEAIDGASGERATVAEALGQ